MSFSPINPTATSGSATLATTFTITGASGVFQATGLSLTLPAAGTYLIFADVRATVNVSAGAGAFLNFEFYNTTDSAVVAGSVRFGPYAGQLNVPVISTTPIHKIVTVAASKTIALYAARNNGTTYSNSSVDADGTNYTQMGFVQLA